MQPDLGKLTSTKLIRAIRSGWSRGMYTPETVAAAARRAQIYQQPGMENIRQRQPWCTDPTPTPLEIEHHTSQAIRQVLQKYPITDHLRIDTSPAEFREFGQYMVDVATAAIMGNSDAEQLRQAVALASAHFGPEIGAHATPAKVVKRRWWSTHARHQLRKAREDVWTHLAPLFMKHGISPDMSSDSAFQDQQIDKWVARTIAKMDGEKYQLPTMEKQRKNTYSEILNHMVSHANALRNTHSAVFFTITLPEKFHPTTTAGDKKRKVNPHWNGTTAGQGHEILQKQWQRFRTAFGKIVGNNWHFLRAAEPHGDGTPHWHIMLWAPKGLEGNTVNLVKKYFINAGLAKGEGPSKHRLAKGIQYKVMGKEAGEGIGYALKYLAKQTGAELNLKDKNGNIIEFSDRDSNPVAWRRAHGIRSFATTQRKATLWRIARKTYIKSDDDDFLELQAVASAPKPDYVQFLKLSEKFAFDVDVKADKWGTITRKIVGVVNLKTGQITRLPKWEIETLPEPDTLRHLGKPQAPPSRRSA